jgi:hypothetical protein
VTTNKGKIFMGLFDWILRKKENHDKTSVPAVKLTVSVEKCEPSPVMYNNFSSEIAGEPVKAEVPTEARAECERLLRKPKRSDSENEYLHYNYWVNVYYKGERHGYHGISDIWTYSARSLPELPLLHEWIYSILGKKRAEIKGDINTVKTWEEKGTIYVLGTYASLYVKVSFKPRGFVLSFLIKDDLRWEDKASYNTKTGQSDFPFYYSKAQGRIIEWGKSVFEEKRIRA